MKSLIVKAIVLIVIIIFAPSLLTVVQPDNLLKSMFDPVNTCTSCPHERFLSRHLCTACRTLDDAGNFCRYMNSPGRTMTIFFGQPSFELKTYMKHRCGNIVGVPAAVCSIVAKDKTYIYVGKYYCKYLGKTCYGEHSSQNGHLFFKEIRCM